VGGQELRRKKLLNDLKEKKKYLKLKRKHKIALCGERALEDGIDVSQDCAE